MGHGIKVLIVDKDATPSVELLGRTGYTGLDITFIPQTDRASTSVRKNPYSLIILGDKLNGGGDTYDVGLEIKQSNHNKHTPVICIAHNMTKLGKLVSLLRPNSFSVDVANEAELAICVERVKNHFTAITPK